MTPPALLLLASLASLGSPSPASASASDLSADPMIRRPPDHPSSASGLRDRRRELRGGGRPPDRDGGEGGVLGTGRRFPGRRDPTHKPADYGGGHPFERAATARRNRARWEEAARGRDSAGAGGEATGGGDGGGGGARRRRGAEDGGAGAEYGAEGGTFGPWWYDPAWTMEGWSEYDPDWYPPPEDDEPDGSGDRPDWFDWSSYRPIRIGANYDGLLGASSAAETLARNALVRDVIMPAATQFWSKALMVYPSRRLYVSSQEGYCVTAPASDYEEGLTGTDLMIYVRATEECGDGTWTAAASSCYWDQYDKPIGGVIKFCYGSIKLQADGTPTAQTIRITIETAIHELAHVLGVSSEDMVYYWDRITAKPRTPRPPVEFQTFECITGDRERVEIPSEDTVAEGFTEGGIRYFEVRTPTVKKVAQNHFNCDRMEGVRLENQPTGGDCFGDHWEERILWNDLLSAWTNTPSIPEFLSPFTLALLEDSGWYRANFTMSRNVPFGHGSGCDFVERPCVEYPGVVPPHAAEFFCASADKATDFKCDPTHSVLATCDLTDLGEDVPEEFRYFEGPTMGGRAFRADYCPIYSDFLMTCDAPVPPNLGKLRTFPAETFGAGGRCFDSDYDRPLCLEASCDRDLMAVRVVMGGEAVACADGESIAVPGTEITVECPRLAVVCPDLVCPAGCSGRGTCRWDADDGRPRCDCSGDAAATEDCNFYIVGSRDGGEAPASSPSRPPSDSSGAGDGVEAFYDCRDWCADVPLPWRSDDAADHAKCDWVFACSRCAECRTVG